MIATGHAMLGLSLAAGTGKLVSEIVAGWELLGWGGIKPFSQTPISIP